MVLNGARKSCEIDDANASNSRFASSTSTRLSSEIFTASIVAKILGTSGNNATAVVTDATAVITFTYPASQYTACHTVITSMKCVNPHDTMNNPNARNIQWNGMSR